jgi:hypothetical protein
MSFTLLEIQDARKPKGIDLLGPPVSASSLIKYQTLFDLLRSLSVYQAPNSAPPCFRHASALHSHANPSSGSPWGPAKQLGPKLSVEATPIPAAAG